jgi:hypothetical protein
VADATLKPAAARAWLASICPARDGGVKGRIEFEGMVVPYRLMAASMRGGTSYVFRFLREPREHEYHLHPEAQAIVDRALQRPSGIVVVAGPTGSGKTTLLYSLLKSLDLTQLSVVTIEDPVERLVEGVVQVSASQTDAGRSFADLTRQLLRMDPDVLMLGELDEPETARLAVKASQTGHLVLTALHAMSAPAVFKRLEALSVLPKEALSEQVSAILVIHLAQAKDGRSRVAIVSACERKAGGAWGGVSLLEAVRHAVDKGLIKAEEGARLLKEPEDPEPSEPLPQGLAAALDSALQEKHTKRLLAWLPALRGYYRRGLTVDQILAALKEHGLEVDRDDLLRRLSP